jgi:hypothetical protein
MAFGTLNLGTLSNVASGTALTVTGTSIAGNAIFVTVGVSSGNSATSIADSQSNSYTRIDTFSASSTPGIAFFWCGSAKALASGVDTVTPTISAGTCDISVVTITGGQGLQIDKHGINDSNTGVSTSLSTGTLTYASNVIIGFAVAINLFGTYTQASGFTGLNGASTSTISLNPARLVQTNSNSVTYAPSWTSSRAYRSLLISVGQPPGGGSLLLGVGS